MYNEMINIYYNFKKYNQLTVSVNSTNLDIKNHQQTFAIWKSKTCLNPVY